jgi:hypothetical protein
MGACRVVTPPRRFQGAATQAMHMESIAEEAQRRKRPAPSQPEGTASFWAHAASLVVDDGSFDIVSSSFLACARNPRRRGHARMSSGAPGIGM